MQLSLKRTVANREENVARLKLQVSDLTRQLSERHQMYLQTDATLQRVVRGDNTEFKRIYELNREAERLKGLARKSSNVQSKTLDRSPEKTGRDLIRNHSSHSGGKNWGALKGHVGDGLGVAAQLVRELDSEAGAMQSDELDPRWSIKLQARPGEIRCPNCGTAKRPHHACRECGYVRPGLQVKPTKPAS